MSTEPTHSQSLFREPGQDHDTSQMASPHLVARRLLIDMYKDILSQDELFDDCTNPFKYGDSESFIIAADNVEEHLPKEPKRAIIVSRGPVVPVKTTINNLRALHVNAIQTDYTLPVQSALSVSCYGQKSRDSEDLASTIWAITLTFRDEIRQRSNLLTLQEPTLNPPQAVDLGDSQGMKYVTTLDMVALYSFNWIVVKESKAWRIKFRYPLGACS